jgi:hypothetical protein
MEEKCVYEFIQEINFQKKLELENKIIVVLNKLDYFSDDQELVIQLRNLHNEYDELKYIINVVKNIIINYSLNVDCIEI